MCWLNYSSISHSLFTKNQGHWCVDVKSSVFCINRPETSLYLLMCRLRPRFHITLFYHKDIEEPDISMWKVVFLLLCIQKLLRISYVGLD